ncbi:ankyrin repeat domain-containing protein [Wolbachia endosymbiont of Tettigetta isshikii]|uniref:ankyrin repeat domain-containing protein n=1 Tax=Wolbachia endosymbiont of Tettigetta isshikii TaxID=3239093 RepID=UPI00397FD474
MDAIIKMLEEEEIRHATNQSEARATRRQTYRSSNTLLQPNNKASEDCRNNEQTSLNSITNANKVDDTLERKQALREREAKAQQLKEAEQRFANSQKRVGQECLHNQYPEQYTPHNGEQASLDLTTDEVSSNDSRIYAPTEEAHEELVKYLKEHKENVNERDGDGRAPLHFAVAARSEKLVKLLIEHRANIDAQNKDEKTPLHLAIAYSCSKITKYLVESKANINAQDRAKHTPLYYAVANNNKRLAKFFIKHRADRSLIKDEDLVTEVQKKEGAEKLKVKLKRSRAQLEEGQKESQSLKRKIHDLENENVALKNKLEKTKNQHSETNKVLLEKAQKDLVELKSCVAGHETKQEALNKLDEENKSLKQKIGDLESENATFKGKLEEAQSQHSNYVAEHEAKLEALNKQNQEKSKLQEQEIKNLKSENATLNSELEKNKNQHSQTSEVSLKKVEKSHRYQKLPT